MDSTGDNIRLYCPFFVILCHFLHNKLKKVHKVFCYIAINV